ncbi:alpha/beta fold hydrolase [Nonomuraea africana]|uniref:3-oxoadipate enol-lactonase n=1 Tax=Nonomuraea africana TaxID=46171 RepID=A0ABR9K669_9ACTN|nr:alpha/beta fold hydrolase [Nonomuraea africana]MBE1557380.1 3-oxoadipate enol-lactonase [Nonomuraea africana]
MAAIVFLHAFGSSGRAWQPQILQLGDRHRALAPDLPGHGATPGPFSLERAVASVRELIQDEPEPVHLVAISGSVIVALLTALAEPDRVAGLILSGGTARGRRGDAVQRVMMRLMPEGMIVNILKGMYSGGKAEHLDQAVQDLRRAGKATVLTGLAELGRLDLSDRLGEIKAPTLVLNGAKDKANLSHAEEIAGGIAGATLRVVPEAGHIWNLEQPDLFTRTVVEFVG